jgi:hypothetical protein
MKVALGVDDNHLAGYGLGAAQGNPREKLSAQLNELEITERILARFRGKAIITGKRFGFGLRRAIRRYSSR